MILYHDKIVNVNSFFGDLVTLIINRKGRPKTESAIFFIYPKFSLFLRQSHGLSDSNKRKNYNLKNLHFTPHVILVEITFFVKKLCDENCATCCAAKGVVRKTNELVVVNGILTKTSCGNTHTTVNIAIESGL